MKKLLLIFCALSILTACHNEPIDSAFNTQGNGNGSSNTSSLPLALSSYSFNTATNAPIIGDLTLNNTYSFNSDNYYQSVATTTITLGQELNVNTEFTRDSNGNLIQSNSYYQGVLSDVTTITYNNENQITQIQYNDIESDNEDYIYNYTYTGNVVTKTEVGSTITTEYTFNEDQLIIRKESFNNSNSILLEILSYDTNGNVISSTMSGEINSSTSYTYDNFNNPLKQAFQAASHLNSLGDKYDDQMANSLSQFNSTNNWNGSVSDGNTFSLTLTYDNQNRILTRNGAINQDDVSVNREETFSYVN